MQIIFIINLVKLPIIVFFCGQRYYLRIWCYVILLLSVCLGINNGGDDLNLGKMVSMDPTTNRDVDALCTRPVLERKVTKFNIQFTSSSPTLLHLEGHNSSIRRS